MKTIISVYNNTRMSSTLIGPGFMLIALYSFFYPEKVTTFLGNVEVHGDEEITSFISIFVVGLLITTLRFTLMKYSKDSQFKNEVPLPTSVDIITTDSVNENIRRYKLAQQIENKDK